ncbi:MAG: hypothetical protein Q4G08_08770 [Capnocytophaga sp.]|nr:hypothetical protein [Capnocytophaga sp.]
MNLKELYVNNKISVRAYRLCVANDIHHMDDLVQLYQQKQHFLALKNCGRKTNEELTLLCKNYNNVSGGKPQGDAISAIYQLSPMQVDTINCYIQVQLKKLSVRSYNALSLFLNQNFDFIFLSGWLLDNSYSEISKIDNVGKKSQVELQHFFFQIKQFSQQLTDDDAALKQIRYSLHAERLFGIKNPPGILLEQSCIFRWFDYLLQYGYLFDTKSTIILYNGWHIYDNVKGKTLEEMASLLGITRERVRQIRGKCLGELSERLSFIRYFNDDLLDAFTHSSSQAWWLDDALHKTIVHKSGVQLSKPMATYLISVYWREHYDLVGNLDDLFLVRNLYSRGRYRWNNLYLVPKGMSAVLNFEELFNALHELLKKRFNNTQVINVDDLIQSNLVYQHFDDMNVLRAIVKKLVGQEFQLKVNRRGEVVLERNTRKRSYEFAYEALEQLGKPSSADEIAERINQLYPEQRSEVSRVRSSLKREHGFVPMGRNNMFALQKWEQDFEDFKGGTIREIAFRYLEKLPTPADHNLLAEHVLKYRPASNKYSILQNLKLDTSKTFVFFDSHTIGLSHKQYPEGYTNMAAVQNAKKTWNERFQELKDFLQDHNRLPYSGYCPKEEVLLYRWYKVQIVRMKSKQLKEDKSLLIAEIYNTYELNNKKRTRRKLK